MVEHLVIRFFLHITSVIVTMAVVSLASAMPSNAQQLEAVQASRAVTALKLYDETNFAIPFDKSNMIIYGSPDQGAGGDGLYKYNTETDTLTLLTLYESGRVYGRGTSSAKGNGVFLLNLQGLLFTTDGSKSGTKLLLDFGYDSCCGTLFFDDSKIKRLQFLNGKFHITIGKAYGYPSTEYNQEVWVTDGRETPKRLLKKDGLIDTFVARVNGKQVIHVVSTSETDESMWVISQLSASGELVPKYRSSKESGGYIGSLVQISKGTFFCSGSSLYRVSNSGVISRDEGVDCGSNLQSYNDRIYYINEQGLWSHTGVTGSSKKILERLNRSTRSCETSSAINFLSYETGELLQLIKGDEKPVLVAPFGSSRSLDGCFGKQVFIGMQRDENVRGYGIHVFDGNTKTVSQSPISNLRLADGLLNEESTLRNDKGELFFMGELRSFSRFERSLIKIRIRSKPENPHLVSPIMLLLEE